MLPSYLCSMEITFQLIWYLRIQLNFIFCKLFSITPQRDTADEEDFDNSVKHVTFQPGEIGPKLVTVGLVDDNVDEPTEKFVVSLSSDGPAILGDPSSVYIEDDDGNYSLRKLRFRFLLAAS